MSQKPELLLSPARLGPLNLSNHVVMAPLTRSRAAAGDVPSDLAVEYYRQRAGAGLIITEASQISPQGKGYVRTPGCYSEEQIAGWRKVTDAVHQAGGKIFLQLWHVGRLSHPSIQPNGEQPVAPSAIRPDAAVFTSTGIKQIETPRALETDEIPAIVDAYRQAAVNARAAGFDGVELHGANGYLIDQFIRDGSNQRTDKYGGSVENRLRFLQEVVEAVTGAIESDRVGVRLSPIANVFSMSDSDPKTTFIAAAKMLSQYRLAYLHGAQFGEGDFDFGEFKRAFGGTYIANGGYTAERAEAALRDGKADLVAFGSLFIANPDLVERFRRGAALNQPDPDTFYQGEEKGYTDYPTLDAA